MDIPKGPYCYNIKKVSFPEGKLLIHTYQCPHWSREQGQDAYCSYVKGGDLLLDDQVKICGENDYTDEEYEEMNK